MSESGRQSANLLREAAAKMRKDCPLDFSADAGYQRIARNWHAVADWLDDEAAWQGSPSGPVRLSAHNPALTLAHAYLGREHVHDHDWKWVDSAPGEEMQRCACGVGRTSASAARLADNPELHGPS